MGTRVPLLVPAALALASGVLFWRAARGRGLLARAASFLVGAWLVLLFGECLAWGGRELWPKLTLRILREVDDAVLLVGYTLLGALPAFAAGFHYRRILRAPRETARVSLALWGGLVLALTTFLGCDALEMPAAAACTAAVTALCAFWWITEPIAIAATSLLPFALFPLLGVLDHRSVAQAYGSSLILLMLGGFLLSAAMEGSGAHRRLAIGIVRLVGGRGRRLVLGFMLATAFCSMWISNTATVLMLAPVALVVLEGDRDRRMTAPLLLGLAYGASIGGIGTPIGTPPNLILLANYREVSGEEISFLEWMTIGIPVVLLMLPLAWLWLTRTMGEGPAIEVARLGPWRRPERRVLVLLGLCALAWATRRDPAGGWSALLGLTTAGDSTVALAAVVLLFVLPDGEGGRLLGWERAKRIPWGLLLLFAGGIAIARAFQASGLADAIGRALEGLGALPLVVTIGILCLCVTFLTEVTSNTATTTLLMPVLAAAELAAGLGAGQLMIPAAISASCAFMLPVATAPNAIVVGSGRVAPRRMAREGLVLNLIGAVVITGLCFVLVGGR